jgi:hypothetical protein
LRLVIKPGACHLLFVQLCAVIFFHIVTQCAAPFYCLGRSDCLLLHICWRVLPSSEKNPSDVQTTVVLTYSSPTPPLELLDKFCGSTCSLVQFSLPIWNNICAN